MSAVKSRVRIVISLVAIVVLSAVLGGLAPAAWADPDTGDTVKVSTATGGSPSGNAGTSDPRHGISSDGRFVVFASNASNLVASDTNGNQDIFLKDMSLGTLIRVSKKTDGTQNPADSEVPDIAANRAAGDLIVSWHTANASSPSDGNGKPDCYIWREATDTVQLVSTSTAGNEGSGGTAGSHDCKLSADGNFVAWESDATGLVGSDTNGQQDIFVKNISGGTLYGFTANQTKRINTSSSGAQATGGNGIMAHDPHMSEDGRFVAFYTDQSNLVSGDTNGKTDEFRKDISSGIIRRVVSSGGGNPNGNSYEPDIDDNGCKVTYHSLATNLVKGDTNGKADVFVADFCAYSGSPKANMISRSPSGGLGNGLSKNPIISGDGLFVAFYSSANNLVSNDSNGTYDVFRRDLTARTTSRASISSTGAQANGTSTGAFINYDGSIVSFQSNASNLTASDTTTPDFFEHIYV
jgi:Tol biopolymer transport system component